MIIPVKVLSAGDPEPVEGAGVEGSGRCVGELLFAMRPHPTYSTKELNANIEHRTSNIEHRTEEIDAAAFTSTFDVGRSMFAF
jgi:hypothetical protein